VRHGLPLIAACAVLACAPMNAAALTYATVTAPDGVPLHVVENDRTEGPPLLILHGIAHSSWAMMPILNGPLCAKRRCVAFDLRGHGQSGKPWTAQSYDHSRPWADDIAAVMQAKNLAKPVLLGWSYGTIVTGDYLRHYEATTLSGVIFSATAGQFTPPARGNAAQAEAAAKRLAAWNGGDTAEQIWAAENVTTGYTAQPLEAEAAKEALVMQMQLPSYVRRLINRRSYDNSDLIPKLATLPLLYIVGDGDPAIVSARALKEKIPAMELKIYEGVRHLPFREAPDRFNADVEAFLLNLPREAR
jgi:pimeloyl-ACP methyl ester carboxylesterase